jgi:hypothetical protein
MVGLFLLGGALLAGAAAGALVGAGVAYAATSPRVYYYLSPYYTVPTYPGYYYMPPAPWYYPPPRQWYPAPYPYYW